MTVRRRSPGFTMLEVVIALVFVSLALLALLRLQLGSIGLARRAEMITRATQLAQSKIAEIQASGFPALGQSSGVVEQGGLLLHWQASVISAKGAMAPLSSDDSLRHISVEVTWDQGESRPSLRLVSAVANGSLR